jgi:hypothetical protein
VKKKEREEGEQPPKHQGAFSIIKKKHMHLYGEASKKKPGFSHHH